MVYLLYSVNFCAPKWWITILILHEETFLMSMVPNGPTIVCCVHIYPIFRPEHLHLVLSANVRRHTLQHQGYILSPPCNIPALTIFRGNGLFTRRHVLMVIKIPFVSAIHRSPKFVVLRSTLNWVLFHLEPFSSNMHFYTSRSLWDPKPKIPNLKSVLCWHFVLQAADALPVGCGSPIL